MNSSTEYARFIDGGPKMIVGIASIPAMQLPFEH
jgi:hypothetical protein